MDERPEWVLANTRKLIESCKCYCNEEEVEIEIAPLPPMIIDYCMVSAES